MSLQRKSLVSFLKSAKTALNSAVQQSTPITFVVGNESAGEPLLRLGVVASGRQGLELTLFSLYSIDWSIMLTAFKILTPSVAPWSLPTCALILDPRLFTFHCQISQGPTSISDLSYGQFCRVRISKSVTLSLSLTYRRLVNVYRRWTLPKQDGFW